VAADDAAPTPPLVWKRTWVDDRPAYYALCGEGLPVLFLHGWGLGPYRNVVRRLGQEGCLVMAPAQPGFSGTASLPAAEFSLAGYARWTEGFLDALNIDEPVVVIGHSFGGGVAIRLAHDAGHRVRSLVLVNSIGGAVWRQGRRLKSLAQRPLWDWGLHLPGDVWPVAQATKVLPVILADLVPNALRNPLGVTKVANLTRKADLTPELEELKRRGMPVTVLWGSRDGVIPRESFEALCAALGAVGKVVEGSHSWLLADPDGLVEVLTNDLRVAKLARDVESHRGRRRRRLSPMPPDQVPTLRRRRG
jgi:pimeloyl-ACP methyl ester carboxylesterase